MQFPCLLGRGKPDVAPINPLFEQTRRLEEKLAKPPTRRDPRLLGEVDELAKVVRTGLDRLQAENRLTAGDVVVRRETVFRVLEALVVVDVSPTVLRRKRGSPPNSRIRRP